MTTIILKLSFLQFPYAVFRNRLGEMGCLRIGAVVNTLLVKTLTLLQGSKPAS